MTDAQVIALMAAVLSAGEGIDRYDWPDFEGLSDTDTIGRAFEFLEKANARVARSVEFLSKAQEMVEVPQ